jgi:hypothetical protein
VNCTNGGQTGDDCGGGRADQACEQRAQPVGVALHYGRRRIARAQETAERRIEFDQHEPRRIDAVFDQRFGDGPGAGTQFDHGTFALRIDIARHGARQHAARRRDRAGRERLLDPRTNEAHLVVEANPVALFEEADLPFDFLLDDLKRLQWHGR